MKVIKHNTVRVAVAMASFVAVAVAIGAPFKWA
jgi:hypothetical protein